MTHQSEQEPEKNLISCLSRLGFVVVAFPNVVAFGANLRAQLEKFNETTFSDTERARGII